MICAFIIFGASGDLTARYLLPTLAQLHQAGKLPDDHRVLGIARENWDTKTFQRHVHERLERYASYIPAASRRALIARLDYRKADATSAEEVREALASIHEAAVLYLALPPAALPSAAQS